MVYHAVGLFHLSLPTLQSPVVSTPIYALSAAYNRISHIERTHIISYESRVWFTKLSTQSSYLPIVWTSLTYE